MERNECSICIDFLKDPRVLNCDIAFVLNVFGMHLGKKDCVLNAGFLREVT
jgi:hypothetical protein